MHGSLVASTPLQLGFGATPVSLRVVHYWPFYQCLWMRCSAVFCAVGRTVSGNGFDHVSAFYNRSCDGRARISGSRLFYHAVEDSAKAASTAFTRKHRLSASSYMAEYHGHSDGGATGNES